MNQAMQLFHGFLKAQIHFLSWPSSLGQKDLLVLLNTSTVKTNSTQKVN